MVSASRTRYATTSGVDVAYQVLGDGPIDLLLFGDRAGEIGDGRWRDLLDRPERAHPARPLSGS